MRRFRKFRDDRFALTTLQNPNLEVRTYAELVQAAQQEREGHPQPATNPATRPPAAPDPLPPALASVDFASPGSGSDSVRQPAAAPSAPAVTPLASPPSVTAVAAAHTKASAPQKRAAKPSPDLNQVPSPSRARPRQTPPSTH